MSKKNAARPASSMPTALDQARDELFSHILRCGVLDAEPEHQNEWMDDTMQYLTDRYPDLGKEALGKVRVLGVRFCQPVVKRAPAAVSTDEVVEAEAVESEEVAEVSA